MDPSLDDGVVYWSSESLLIAESKTGGRPLCGWKGEAVGEGRDSDMVLIAYVDNVQ
jgi:hypothetical protein